jgi:hypothetical protein
LHALRGRILIVCDSFQQTVKENHLPLQNLRTSATPPAPGKKPDHPVAHKPASQPATPTHALGEGKVAARNAMRKRLPENITEDTVAMLEKNPELFDALANSPRAATALTLCNSPCIPDFASAAQVTRIEGLLQEAEQKALSINQTELKEFLHATKNRTDLNRAIRETQDSIRSAKPGAEVKLEPRRRPDSTQPSVPKTPEDVARAIRAKYQGALVDPDHELEKIIARVRHPSLRVDGRAASGELRDLIHILESGTFDGKQVANVKLIAPSSAGRTPDRGITFVDLTTARDESVSVTSASRGHLRHDPDTETSGAALARVSESRAATQSKVEHAILNKAKHTSSRPSQLTAPLVEFADGGRISVTITKDAGLTSAMIDDIMRDIRLGDHVQSVKVTNFQPRSETPSAPHLREVSIYTRQANGSYVLTSRTSVADP